MAGGGVETMPDDPTDAQLLDGVRRLVSAFRSIERVVAGRLQLNTTDSAAMELLGRGGPLTPKQLAERLGVSPAAVTFVLDRLEQAGHVRRTPNPADRRSTLIEAAPASVRSAGQLMRPVATGVHAVFDGLDAGERALLLTMWDRLADVFDGALAEIAAGGIDDAGSGAAESSAPES